jgi:hypothetical protein
VSKVSSRCSAKDTPLTQANPVINAPRHNDRAFIETSLQAGPIQVDSSLRSE